VVYSLLLQYFMFQKKKNPASRYSGELHVVSPEVVKVLKNDKHWRERYIRGICAVLLCWGFDIGIDSSGAKSTDEESWKRVHPIDSLGGQGEDDKMGNSILETRPPD
jgi:hypothetical protein